MQPRGVSPIKYQYASSASGPWHDTQLNADKYRRESFDGGMTWGTGYKFVGSDGYSPTLPGYIKSTYIDETSVLSPTITGGTIIGSKIYATDGGAFYAQMTAEGFQIYQDSIASPKMNLYVTNDGNLVALRLGAGGMSSSSNIFELRKETTFAQCVYTTPTGEDIGFKFTSNGEIQVMGTLTGATAVFS